MRKGQASPHFANDPDTPNPWLPSRTCIDSGMRRRGFSTQSSGPSGVAAFAYGELGTQHRSAYGAVVRTNPEREAASGNGLPLLSGHHSLGAAVLGATHGSSGGTGTVG